MSTNNINNPIYKLPFDYGFTREVVERKKFSKNGPKFDVYYYTSDKRKLRSLNDVKRCLGSLPLKLEYFTFQKVPIGVGAPKEICRKANENIRNEEESILPKENLTMQQKIHICYPFLIKAVEQETERLRGDPNTHNEQNTLEFIDSLDIRAIMDNAIEQYNMTKQKQNNDPSNQNQASTSK